MEKRDLYDINRNLTGETIYKGEPIPKSRYISVVLSFIQNSKGEFLIQKRSKQKKGKYGSTGGHSKAGETSLQGIIAEIREEIGLKVAPEELKLISSGREDTDQVFYDIYYLKKDFNISDLILQKEEVDFVEWVSETQLKSLIDNGEFLDKHVAGAYALMDALKKK